MTGSLIPETRSRAGGEGCTLRLVGIDLARFLAIAGMIVVHVEADPFGWLTRLGVGNASALFAVLGGVSVVLATRRYLDAGAVAAARWAMMGRGAFVIIVGIALSFVGSPAVVVLVYFGVAMCCSIPLLTAPTPVLLTVAGLLAVGGPVLNAFVRHQLGIVTATSGSIGPDLFTDPLGAVQGVFLTGQYPVVTWVVYVLAGMVVCRLLLSALRRGGGNRFAVFLAGWGIVSTTAVVVVSDAIAGLFRSERLAAVPAEVLASLPPGITVEDFLALPGTGSPSWEWWSLLGATAHTGSLLDILRGVGLSMSAIGMCLLLAWTLPAAMMVTLRPFSRAGAAPLTIYSVHVVLLGIATAMAVPVFEQDGAIPWWARGSGAVGLHLAVAVLIGLTLALTGRRGPLEALAAKVSELTAKLGRTTSPRSVRRSGS